MKIKSTVEKMHDYGFINFSKTPDSPINEKGEIRNPIITKKEFRKLQAGQEITVNEKQLEKINDRFPGLLEVEENKDLKSDSKPESADSKPELNITIENNQ